MMPKIPSNIHNVLKKIKSQKNIKISQYYENNTVVIQTHFSNNHSPQSLRGKYTQKDHIFSFLPK